jgi:hypothetical protein
LVVLSGHAGAFDLGLDAFPSDCRSLSGKPAIPFSQLFQGHVIVIPRRWCGGFRFCRWWCRRFVVCAVVCEDPGSIVDDDLERFDPHFHVLFRQRTLHGLPQKCDEVPSL